MSLIPKPTKEFLFAKSIGEGIPQKFSKTNRKKAFINTWAFLANSRIFELLIPKNFKHMDKTLDFLEGFGYGCQNNSIIVALGAHCFAAGGSLNKFAANPEQKKLLRALREGSQIGGFAATEENAGSDIMAMECNYSKDKRGFVLNGSKCYIKNIRDADIFIILSKRNPRLYHRGIGAFIVPATAKGLKIGPDTPRMGLTDSTLGTLTLKDVWVPKNGLIGKENRGHDIFNHAMLIERSLIFGIQLGGMRRLLEKSIAFAKKRKQFRRPIGSFQLVQSRIVDMYQRYMLSRLLIRETGVQLSKGTITNGMASLTKLFLSEAILKTCEDSLRIHGAAGYMEKNEIPGQLKDSYGGIIYSGTSDIQRLIIGKELGL